MHETVKFFGSVQVTQLSEIWDVTMPNTRQLAKISLPYSCCRPSTKLAGLVQYIVGKYVSSQLCSSAQPGQRLQPGFIKPQPK